jgi:hypothetical protein
MIIGYKFKIQYRIGTSEPNRSNCTVMTTPVGIGCKKLLLPILEH